MNFKVGKYRAGLEYFTSVEDSHGEVVYALVPGQNKSSEELCQIIIDRVFSPAKPRRNVDYRQEVKK